MSPITTCPRRVARQHLHHRVGRPVAQRSLVHLDHRAQARVQFDHPAREVHGHHRGALVRRDDEHLRRRLSVPDEVVQRQARRQQRLAFFLEIETRPCLGRGSASYRPSITSALPGPQPQRGSGLRALGRARRAAVPLDERDDARCPTSKARRGAVSPSGPVSWGPAVTPDGIGRADQRPATGGRSGSGVEVVRPQRIAHRVRVRGVVGLHPCH
jgi:hypothetical protein